MNILKTHQFPQEVLDETNKGWTCGDILVLS